jgi:hypothetical protein
MIGTLLFSGSDLASVARILDLSEFWSSADLRGDLPTSSGMDGATPLRRPVAAQVRTAQVSVSGSSAAATEAAVDAVKSLVKPNVAHTLTRRKVTASGLLDVTQSAITRGVAERWTTEYLCQLLISVETLDGPWYGASESIAAVGTVTIKGDSPTRKITATLSAGAVNPVVTNASNGYTFRYVGTVPTGGVVVDVLARKATGTAGDLSSALKWSKDDPFQLDPGAQTLAVSAGTASFTYYPAYV